MVVDILVPNKPSAITRSAVSSCRIDYITEFDSHVRTMKQIMLEGIRQPIGFFGIDD